MVITAVRGCPNCAPPSGLVSVTVKDYKRQIQSQYTDHTVTMSLSQCLYLRNFRSNVIHNVYRKALCVDSTFKLNCTRVWSEIYSTTSSCNRGNLECRANGAKTSSRSIEGDANCTNSFIYCQLLREQDNGNKYTQS